MNRDEQAWVAASASAMRGSVPTAELNVEGARAWRPAPARPFETKRPATRPLVCLDFDGVLHAYNSGWQGATVIPDPPVPGALDFVDEASRRFRVAIYSSRSGEPGGIRAMQDWLRSWLSRERSHADAAAIMDRLEWPTTKPPAHLTVDDRAWPFTGDWPEMDEIAAFKPWNRGGKTKSGWRAILTNLPPQGEVLLCWHCDGKWKVEVGCYSCDSQAAYWRPLPAAPTDADIPFLNPLLAPFAAAGFAIAASALSLAADLMTPATAALRGIVEGHPPDPPPDPSERVARFLDEIAGPLETLNRAAEASPEPETESTP